MLGHLKFLLKNVQSRPNCLSAFIMVLLERS